MKLSDVVAFMGHQVHGKRVLDVAGGDGYWAGRARRRGAQAVSIDLARGKMVYGRTLADAPALVECDALRLPFGDGSFDAILSVCAIEHFDDGGRSLDEMARVLKPGGEIFMSADVLSRADAWPKLRDAHKAKYHVQHTYTHESLRKLMDERGLDLVRHSYQFRTAATERLYLSLSTYGGKVGFNAAAPLAPLVALADRNAPNQQGSIVLIHSRKR
jgi:ubiquinone/menaquinone biosynthesis C-methylase UbiE